MKKNEYNPFSLDDKIAIVTGATSGIGRAISISLAKFGANIVIVGRDLTRAEKVSKEIKELGRETLIVKADVTKRDDVQAIVNNALSKFGRIDILVNSAGIAKIEGPAEDLSESDWDETIAVNLKGTFLCCQAAGRVMIKQNGGKIINIASTDGVVGVPHEAAYCASKGGVIALTKALAVEWAKYNICVNAIVPCETETPMHFAWVEALGEEFVKFSINRMPLARSRGIFPKAEDVANAAVFLASKASDWITGSAIYVDGGCLAE